MQTARRDVNPFALMIDPQSVIAKVENSERLERLNRRICRPLDKPLLGAVADGSEPAANAGSACDAVADGVAEADADAAADPQAVADLARHGGNLAA